jgi:hypothetical protein
MNITSSYGDYSGSGYGDYGYGGSSIIDNSTNMFPSIHPNIEPSITISTHPTRVILSIMTNSPTSNENISITEENYTLSKAKSNLMFGLVLGIALLGGITTSFVFHKLRTYLKKPQNIEEEPIFAPDITIIKDDEL